MEREYGTSRGVIATVHRIAEEEEEEEEGEDQEKTCRYNTYIGTYLHTTW